MYRGQFLDSAAGRVHLAVFGSLEGRHLWLYLPPFAEEMNLARALVTRQARALVDAGDAVACLDFYGTGDSEGEFEQACLAHWWADLDAALAWARAQGVTSVSLWGLRLGALLALSYAQERSLELGRSLLFWKPVLDGRQMLGQFFRLKQVSDSLQGGAKVNWLARAREGETVEVAGYLLNPQLVADLEALKLPARPPEVERLDWLEIGARAVSPAIQKATRDWPSDRLQLDTCEGPQFWHNPDCYEAPAVIEQGLRVAAVLRGESSSLTN